MSQKIWLSAVMVLVILTASVYIMMPGQVKLVVEDTRSKFYVWEDNSWVLGGTEYVYLFDGSKKMRAKNRSLSHNTLDGMTEIVRESHFKEGIVVVDKYTFESSNTDVELFPVDHIVTCHNCEGKIVHFEYRDLEYNGETRIAESPESFGHRMKVEWQDGYDWAKVYQQKVASDKLIIRYRPASSVEEYHVRLFDPSFNITIDNPANNSAIPGSSFKLDWVVNGTPETCQYSLDSGSNQTGLFSAFTGTTIDTSNEATAGSVRGIASNGTTFWLAGQASPKDVISEWDFSGNMLSVSNFSLGGLTNLISDITYTNFSGNSRIWYVVPAVQYLCESYLNGTTALGCGDIGNDGAVSPFGIDNNGTHLFVADYNQKKIMVYNATGDFVNNITISEVAPFGIAMNSSHMWISGKSVFQMLEYTVDGTLVRNMTDLFEHDVTYMYFNNSNSLLYCNQDDTSDVPVRVYKLNESTNNVTINGLSEGSHTIEIFCNDTGGTFSSSGLVYFSAEVNHSLLFESLASNISVESGKLVNITSLNNLSEVCLDIDYLGYGVNYSCGTPPLTVILNITFFTTDLLNNSDSVVLAYDPPFQGAQNVSVVAEGFHEYSEIINFTFDLDGDILNLTPTDVKVYVNDTLAADVGDLQTGTTTLTDFNEYTVPTNLTYNGSSIKTLTLTIPSSATVTHANITMKGYENGGSCFQETANQQEDCGALSTGYYSSEPNYVYVTYTKPSDTNQSLSKWSVSIGEDGIQNPIGPANYTIPASCWDQDTSLLKLRLYSSYNFLTGVAQSYGQCYNDSWVNVTTIMSSSTAASSEYAGSVSLAYDGNYASRTFYDSFGGGWYQFSNQVNNASLYEEAMFWVYNNKTPSNPYLEVGTIDGVREWSFTGNFNGTNTSDDFASVINNYLDSCSGSCSVPFYFSSGSRGILEVNDLNVRYTFVFNPILLNVTVLNQFLNNSNGFVDIPLSIECTENTEITVSDINISYRGGNSSMIVTAHDDTYTNNISRNLTYLDSIWNHTFPPRINYFEFIPNTPTSSYVAPTGQSNTYGILNITSLAYAQDFDYYLKVNESGPDSCVNLSYSTTNSSSSSTLLDPGTWFKVFSDASLEESNSIWLWANYSCNRTSWYMWQPDLDGRACCTNCTGCTGE